MTHRITLEPAYIIHRRAYSNTSYILDFFTRSHGRMSMLARSARGLKSRYRGKLELFVPMLISYSGKSDLKNLGSVEFYQAPIDLDGEALLCAFYLNELLYRLMQREDPHQHLYDAYEKTLFQLHNASKRQAALRLFEKVLLHECGYGLEWRYDIKTKAAIDPQGFYQYHAERGFSLTDSLDTTQYLISGKTLLAFADEAVENLTNLTEAKRLMRLLLGSLLDGQPLFSRGLF